MHWLVIINLFLKVLCKLIYEVYWFYCFLICRYRNKEIFAHRSFLFVTKLHVFFDKHNAYRYIQPGISEKNKHVLSILSSLKNSCSLLFSCLKSHSEVYSEPCQTLKMKFLRKIVNGFYPLNIFTKNFILDVWQGSDYASLIFSKVAGLQPTTLLKDGLLHRYLSRILAT